MRLRWLLLIAVALGFFLTGAPIILYGIMAVNFINNCENCTVASMDVFALDYFTAHRLPRTGFAFELCCGDWWTGAIVSGQTWGYNYSTPLRNHLNLSNVFLVHQGNDVLQMEYAGGGNIGTWDLSSIRARSRTINFTVTDELAGNATLVFGRKPINASTAATFKCGGGDSGFYGTSYNATLMDSNGTLVSAFYFQLPNGDDSTSLLPLTDPNVSVYLNGPYTLMVDFWMYAYDEMPVCYKGRYNYHLNDPILLLRYVSNAPPSLNEMSNLNTSYHIPSSVVGRVLDDLGVYSVRISSGKHGTSEPIVTGGLKNKSFQGHLNAYLNGPEEVNMTITDAYNQSTIATYNRYIDDASDMIVEGVGGLGGLLLGDIRNTTIQILNNGTLPIIDAVLNFSHGQSTGINLGVGERGNFTLILNTSGWRGGRHEDFCFKALNNTLEYDGDNQVCVRQKAAFNKWATDKNVSLYWKNTSIQSPNGTEINRSITTDESDYQTFDYNAADYGIPYFKTVFEVDQAKLQADGKVLTLRVWNSSSGTWSNASGPTPGWIINVTKTPGMITMYNYHYTGDDAFGFIVEDDNTVPPPPPPPASSPPSGGPSGGGGTQTRHYAVISNEVDSNISGRWIREATGKSSYSNSLTWYNSSNHTACASQYRYCIFLGGQDALSNMSYWTRQILDSGDRDAIMVRPYYTCSGRLCVIAGRNRVETGEAARRYADDIIT